MAASSQGLKISYVIQHHRPAKNGMCGIFCRISVNGTQLHFSTKLSVQPDRWLVQEHRTAGKTKEERECNETLDDLRSLIRRRYFDLISNGEPVSALILKNSVLQLDDKCVTLLALCDKFIEDYYQLVLSKSVVQDTYQRYVYTRRRLGEYMEEKYNIQDISIKNINHNFIKGFDLWLLNRHHIGINSTAKLVKCFRTMFNLALNNGWIQADPFASYKIQTVKVDRDYLTQEELSQLMAKEFSSPRLSVVKDMFLFSCYTGLSYADVEKLTQNDLQIDGRGVERSGPKPVGLPCFGIDF